MKKGLSLLLAMFTLLTPTQALAQTETVIDVNKHLNIKEAVLGDVNSDSGVDLKDVVLLVGGLLNAAPDLDPRTCDCNLDGSVNLRDAAILAQQIAGWRTAEDGNEVEINVSENVSELDKQG